MANKVKFNRRSGRQKKSKQPRFSSKSSILLEQALAHHQAGRFPEAETLYRKILFAEPHHHDALHFMGMLAYQSGKSNEGVELISKALSLCPDYVDAHNSLGVILNGLGRLDDAAAHFRWAIALKPAYAEAHSNLGNTLMAQGQEEQAITHFRRAIALKPAYAEAHGNLGNALKTQNQLEEAVACLLRALSLKPAYAEAHNDLGIVLRAQGKLDEAVACYRQAITLKPAYAEAYSNLGNALKDLGNLDEAGVSFEKALSLKPDYVEGYHNLGNLLQQSGNFGDAAANFRKALSIRPHYGEVYRMLSAIAKFACGDPDIKVMEELYARKDLANEDKIHLGFALGKVFEDLKQYDTSFRFVAEANQLQRGSYEYSSQADHDFFERIENIFSPAFFSSHQGPGNPAETPIFIIGMPRSGTTIAEQILSSHPLVFGAGELNYLADLTAGLCSGKPAGKFPECIPRLDEAALQKMGSDYITKIRRHSKEAKHITDKMPHNFLNVGLIKVILPNARIIHCMRDPMDNCLSIFKNYFSRLHKYAYDMTELGRYYLLYRGLMKYWERVLPGFMYPLRYEELVCDQQNQTEKLLGFCGLSWDEACLSFHKTNRIVQTASSAQVRQPMYNDSIKLWKHYETQLEPLRKALDV